MNIINNNIINKNIILGYCNNLSICFTQAYKYYYDCLNDNNCPNTLPNPESWLLNQTYMRSMWEFMINDTLNSTFRKYMDYMYNSYNKDFTNKVIYYLNVINPGQSTFHRVLVGRDREAVKYLFNV